jgi:hypothetical protein
VQIEAASPRKNGYALTGRVVDAKVEADGDIHLALQDADGKNAGTVSAEIPVGPKWCEIRQIVFGWTKQKFPFTVKSVHDLTIAEHVVTVTGKAFYDIAHAPADHVALTDLTHFRIFPRNLALHLTQYLSEHRKEGLKIMNHQDSGTIIVTFLLLLPWLGRAAVATVALWREHIETQGRKAKQNF